MKLTDRQKQILEKVAIYKDENPDHSWSRTYVACGTTPKEYAIAVTRLEYIRKAPKVIRRPAGKPSAS